MRRTSLGLVATYLATACLEPSVRGGPGSLSLGHKPDLILSLSLPPNNRPEGAPAPSEWTLSNSPELTRTEQGVDEYQTAFPAHLLFYGSTNKKSPPEMTILDPSGEALVFEARTPRMGTVHTWSYSNRKIFFRIPEGTEPPAFTVRLPLATEAEARLNFQTSELTPEAFAMTSIPAAKAWRQGLYLPAPSSIRFGLTVPRDGHLSFRAQLLEPPVITGATSDGATVVVEATRAGVALTLGHTFLAPGDSQNLKFDLSEHAGEAIELQIRTAPLGNSDLDYVLIGNPTLYTPKERPRRVLMVFIDTLRPDRLGIYGHHRDTTPVLDSLAAGAIVFDQARAPSSWTLPSGRASVTGRWPDRWDAGPHLGQVLGEEGWATMAVVTNAYMTQAFGMAKGWSVHQSNMGLSAEQEVRRALELLEDHGDRDLMLWLHLIDPHLPYTEDSEFQALWAGERPPQLVGSITEKSATAAWEACETNAERDTLSQYLLDRYDQNIRAADAALAPLLEAIGDEALVVVYSDHGEEFFEHGRMGHGHSLSEELLTVPLIIRDPSLPAGRVSAPVSLLDIAPTILELLALPLPEGEAAMDGVSLVGAAHGGLADETQLQHRPQAYGRILFGDDSWGVLLEGKKWVSSGMTEQLFDLESDPTEDRNLLDTQTLDTQIYLDALAERLGRPVSRVWRADAAGEHVFIKPHTGQLWFSHPENLGQAWTRWDPMSKRTSPFEESRRVGLHRDQTHRSPRELFIEPGSSPVGARLELRLGERVYVDTLSAAEFEAWTPGEPLLQIGPKSRPAHFGWTVQPEPLVNTEADLDSDVEAALEAMGYLD